MVIFFLFFIIKCIGWPIFAGDTDLWYHLNGGRYIIQNMSIPKDSFFSFVEPPREWIDYYWLFQVITYLVFCISQYYGLIILKAIVFVILFYLIFRILFADRKKEKGLYPVFVFMVVFLMFAPRYSLMRPHIFTYLFIVSFIFILEHKPHHIFMLPFLSFLWMNIHGIAYPVMLLISLSYLVDFYFQHKRHKKAITKKEALSVIPLIISISTVFLTPHGFDLTWVPFIETGFASHYIAELRYFTSDELTSFHIVKMFISINSLIILILLMTLFSLVASLYTWNIRISHLLMFLGGVFILTKGYRFCYEFSLLSLPLIKDNVPELSISDISEKRNRVFASFFVIIFAILPFVYVKNIYANPPKYPFSIKNLPHGNSNFLRYIDIGGSILNHPNYGGYLQWVLYPKYRIYMDMEVPFLFTNEDMYIADKMFISKSVFQKMVDRYRPHFVLVPLGFKGFKEIVAHFPNYRVVFFDDMDVLYADMERSRQVLQDYEIKAIDPFVFAYEPREILEKKGKEELEAIIRELERMRKIYPESIISNQFMAMYNNRMGMYEKAIVYCRNIIHNFPEIAIGYRLMGDAYKGLKMYKKALEYYKKSLHISYTPNVQREIGLLYLEQGRYKEAYDTLIKTSNIYAPGITYRELYHVILAALYSDHIKEMEVLYRYAKETLSLEDKTWYEKYERLEEIINEKRKR